MKKSDSLDLDGTSEIIRIAYRQSREIAGCDNDDSSKSTKDGLVCTHRFMNFPFIANINSRIAGAYTSVKQSDCRVETILKKTEQRLTEGAKIFSPVSSKIGATLEEPLKSIDSLICDGLDYFEENLPSLKLPPEIHKNFEGYTRNVSDNVKKNSNEVYADVKLRLDELTKIVRQTAKSDNPISNEQKSD